jgi:hypothetical protein
MRQILVIVILACFALLLSVASAAATTPEEAESFLNQQRAANSIPAFTTLNPAFVSWCPEEDKPEYSAGESFRDWAGGGSWSSTESPGSPDPCISNHFTTRCSPQWATGK